MGLLEILMKRFSDSFAIERLERGASPDYIAQKIAQNAPNFKLKYKLSLEEYKQIYLLNLYLPPEVEGAIALSRGSATFGHSFSVPYFDTLSALEHLDPTVYEDDSLIKLLITAKNAAMVALAADSQTTGENPQNHFDMDRE